MTDILKAKSVTAKQIPVLSFALREVLIASSPTLESWCYQYLRTKKPLLTAEEFQEKWRSWKRNQNELANKNEFKGGSVEDSVKDWAGFYFDGQTDEVEKMLEAYRSSVKLVFPHYVEQVLQTLKDRAYRLACVTNEESSVSELLKMFRLLDLLEVVIFCRELNAPKPEVLGFQDLMKDLSVQSKEIVHIGSRYSTDLVACSRLGIACVLYDPKGDETSSLPIPEDLLQQKVVSLSSLRQNRYVDAARVIRRFEELLDIFQ